MLDKKAKELIGKSWKDQPKLIKKTKSTMQSGNYPEPIVSHTPPVNVGVKHSGVLQASAMRITSDSEFG